MKKLVLSASMLMLGLASANAQITTTSVMDDFAEKNTNSFWYSGASTAPQDGDNTTAGQLRFVYPTNPGAIYLGVDFGGSTTVDLSTMADIELGIENQSATKDLVVRILLKDVDGNLLEMEPNVSDCAGIADFGTPSAGISWTAAQQVYPAHDLADPAVYPRVSFNGFVLEKATTNTIRIDLSSVAGTVGGRKFGTWAGTAPANSPNTSTAVASGFKIAQVKSVEFQMNENQFDVRNFSGSSVDQQSYRFDVQAPAQTDYSGTVIIHSFKLGSVLAALPNDITTGIYDATSSSKLSVFPNPAKDALTVSFEATNGATLSLSNIAGNKVLSTTVAAGSNQTTLNTSGLASGIYILNVATENGTEARKVVIQ